MCDNETSRTFHANHHFLDHQVFFPIFVFIVSSIIMKGPKFVDPAKADIYAGVAEADADEAYWKERYVAPQTMYQKFMDWLF
jgi:hypothetical protein